MKLQRPKEPAVLAKARGALERGLAAVWAKGQAGKFTPDDVIRSAAVTDALHDMTGGNCAYCERALITDGTFYSVVTHHRPVWGAVGADGSVDMAAYWPLTYHWGNLYPACTDCVRAKGTRFPVDGGRATSVEDVDKEKPLLLDPVADDVAEHLRYEADGMVHALTERGRVTCDILALNRDDLVHRRRAVAADPTTAGSAFPTMRAQLAGTSKGRVPDPAGRTVSPDDSLAPPPPVETAPPEYEQVGSEGPVGHDLSSGMGNAELGSYFNQVAWIERVVIKNFRPIRDMDLDLARSTSDQGPWTVLLGENGSGKSSVLHAVALTLMGGEQRRSLGIDARKYLRHRARSGLVQVFLTGRTEPLELRWGSGDVEFTGPEQVPALLLGYGATRLLPSHGGVTTDGRVVRVDNLFDPLLPLTDPTSWLLSLDEATFEDIAEGIHGLLALGDDSCLVRTKKTVRLRQGRSEADLTTLSDGYQSMVVMATDILRTVMTMWPRPELAEGIVLVDEVGAHLHPRWRMRVVGAFRKLLPRVQFIISTHDPLCLRGVLDGEVVVVRRNSDGEVVTIVDLPPLTGMRIDQLLTSEHFGLGSTDDPEVADLWDTYYRLEGVPRPNAAQREELERVKARLGELEQFGTTERERMLLTSAAEYIARRRETGDAAAPSSKEMTSKLADLWDTHLGAP